MAWVVGRARGRDGRDGVDFSRFQLSRFIWRGKLVMPRLWPPPGCVGGPDHQTPPQNSELSCGEENNPRRRRRMKGREVEEGRRERGRVCPQSHLLSFFLFLSILKTTSFLIFSLSHSSKTTFFSSFFYFFLFITFLIPPFLLFLSLSLF